MTLDQTFEISPNVISRDVDGELVLLNLENGLYFGLDPVGYCIWSRLKDGDSLRAAHSELLELYDVSPETLKEDIVALTQSLIDHQLVVAVDA